jgi:hypothetical protein
MKGQRNSPSWLQPYWQAKREATTKRISAAIASLQEKRIDISLAAICKEIKESGGNSMSPNSIKRNPEAYEIYLRTRPQLPKKLTKGIELKALTSDLDGADRRAMHARIARLRKESKDTLIARLIAVEHHRAKQELSEQRLRDQIITLSFSVSSGRGHLPQINDNNQPSSSRL